MSFAVNKELGIMCKLNRPVGIDEEKKEPGHPNVLSIRELYVFLSVHLSLSLSLSLTLTQQHQVRG